MRRKAIWCANAASVITALTVAVFASVLPVACLAMFVVLRDWQHCLDVTLFGLGICVVAAALISTCDNVAWWAEQQLEHCDEVVAEDAPRDGGQ